MTKRRAVTGLLEEAWRVLIPLWPDTRPLLAHQSCFELLCGVVLSAQTTDEQVNAVTPALFSRWPDPRAMAAADIAAVETVIHSVGFYRTKARHLVETAKILEERCGGLVPSTMDELLSLPGVGRKTANLVISSCFGKPGIIVDTHVMRVALRLGIQDRADPTKIEATIGSKVPQERWTALSHALNRHGKHVCTARKPACPTCPLEAICPRIGLSSAKG
jgi:endonuclease-3